MLQSITRDLTGRNSGAASPHRKQRGAFSFFVIALFLLTALSTIPNASADVGSWTSGTTADRTSTVTCGWSATKYMCQGYQTTVPSKKGLYYNTGTNTFGSYAPTYPAGWDSIQATNELVPFGGDFVGVGIDAVNDVIRAVLLPDNLAAPSALGSAKAMVLPNAFGLFNHDHATGLSYVFEYDPTTHQYVVHKTADFVNWTTSGIGTLPTISNRYATEFVVENGVLVVSHTQSTVQQYIKVYKSTDGFNFTDVSPTLVHSKTGTAGGYLLIRHALDANGLYCHADRNSGATTDQGIYCTTDFANWQYTSMRIGTTNQGRFTDRPGGGFFFLQPHIDGKNYIYQISGPNSFTLRETFNVLTDDRAIGESVGGKMVMMHFITASAPTHYARNVYPDLLAPSATFTPSSNINDLDLSANGTPTVYIKQLDATGTFTDFFKTDAGFGLLASVNSCSHTGNTADAGTAVEVAYNNGVLTFYCKTGGDKRLVTETAATLTKISSHTSETVAYSEIEASDYVTAIDNNAGAFDFYNKNTGLKIASLAHSGGKLDFNHFSQEFAAWDGTNLWVYNENGTVVFTRALANFLHFENTAALAGTSGSLTKYDRVGNVLNVAYTITPAFTQAALTPDGRYIVTYLDSGNVLSIYNATDGALVKTAEASGGPSGSKGLAVDVANNYAYVYSSAVAQRYNIYPYTSSTGGDGGSGAPNPTPTPGTVPGDTPPGAPVAPTAPPVVPGGGNDPGNPIGQAKKNFEEAWGISEAVANWLFALLIMGLIMVGFGKATGGSGLAILLGGLLGAGVALAFGFLPLWFMMLIVFFVVAAAASAMMGKGDDGAGG